MYLEISIMFLSFLLGYVLCWHRSRRVFELNSNLYKQNKKLFEQNKHNNFELQLKNEKIKLLEQSKDNSEF